jgi:hypothetical protein
MKLLIVLWEGQFLQGQLQLGAQLVLYLGRRAKELEPVAW